MARAQRRVGAGVLSLLLAAAGVPGLLQASDACPAEALRALAGASLLPAGHSLPPAAHACKVWPYDDRLALAAVAYQLPAAGTEPQRELRLVVAILDAHDARPIAVHRTDLAEDALLVLADGGLRLDTARYDLAPGVRAFGVVMQSSARGPSCPDAGFNDELTLYVRDGDALRPVFSSYLDLWQRVEGEPCSWTRAQRLVTEEAALTIGVEPDARHGYADLRVIANVARIERAAGSGWDDAVTTRRRTSQIVRYDGARYDVDPLQHGFFWTRDSVDE